MTTPLDNALADLSGIEATYNADVDTVANIQSNIAAAQSTAQTAIETATAPLAPAQSKLLMDTAPYIAKLQSVDQLVQAKIAELQATLPASDPGTGGTGADSGTQTPAV